MIRRSIGRVALPILLAALVLNSATSAEGTEAQPKGSDPFTLAPLEASALTTALAAGEKAAAEIRGVVFELAEARRQVARDGSDAAGASLSAASAALASNATIMRTAGEQIDAVQFAHRELVEDHRQAAAVLDRRLAVLYAAGPTRGADDLVDGHDLVSARAKQILLNAVLTADQERLLATYIAATTDVVDVASLAGSLSYDRASRAEMIEEFLVVSSLADAEAMKLVEAQALLDDVAFPVAADYSFVDTFLAPRMAGARDVHRHQGIDIFAPLGTPLVAVERGLVVRVGEVRLGGLRLWLIGESGAQYYYAHLSAFADITEGQFVETGTVLGYVGNTGNARSTPHHVHFQVHPGGGTAVNGYPLLVQLETRDKELAAHGQPGYGLCPRRDGVPLAACGD